MQTKHNLPHYNFPHRSAILLHRKHGACGAKQHILQQQHYNDRRRRTSNNLLRRLSWIDRQSNHQKQWHCSFHATHQHTALQMVQNLYSNHQHPSYNIDHIHTIHLPTSSTISNTQRLARQLLSTVRYSSRVLLNMSIISTRKHLFCESSFFSKSWSR